MRLLGRLASVAVVWLTTIAVAIGGTPHIQCTCPDGRVKLFFTLSAAKDCRCQGGCCTASPGKKCVCQKSSEQRSCEQDATRSDEFAGPTVQKTRCVRHLCVA